MATWLIISIYDPCTKLIGGGGGGSKNRILGNNPFLCILSIFLCITCPFLCTKLPFCVLCPFSCVLCPFSCVICSFWRFMPFFMYYASMCFNTLFCVLTVFCVNYLLIEIPTLAIERSPSLLCGIPPFFLS